MVFCVYVYGFEIGDISRTSSLKLLLLYQHTKVSRRASWDVLSRYDQSKAYEGVVDLCFNCD